MINKNIINKLKNIDKVIAELKEGRNKIIDKLRVNDKDYRHFSYDAGKCQYKGCKNKSNFFHRCVSGSEIFVCDKHYNKIPEYQFILGRGGRTVLVDQGK